MRSALACRMRLCSLRLPALRLQASSKLVGIHAANCVYPASLFNLENLDLIKIRAELVSIYQTIKRFPQFSEVLKLVRRVMRKCFSLLTRARVFLWRTSAKP